jgi:hypothetical protein
LFTVTRTSDSTTQAAPQSTNGCADPAPLDTFCANTVCFISTLNDQSGNAFDCVGTAANGPQWMPNIVINGQRAIRFPSVPHTIGSLTTVAKLCTAEGVTSWSTSSYSIVFAGRVSLSAGPASLFTDSPASAGFSTAGNNHVAAIFGSGGIAPQLAIPVTPITLGFTTIGGVGGAKLWVGNDFAVANTVALGTKTGLILGTASTQYQRMDLLSFTLYATPLTDAQMLNVRTSVAGQWKIPPQCCDFIVSVHGDSLNTGDGSVTQVGYPNRAIELQNTPVKMYNFSTFGNNLVGNGGILALATTDMNLIWRSNARLMLEIIEGGANDIRAGILTSTLIDGIRAWNPTFKLNRPNLKVMYATTPLQSNTLANLGWLDQAHSFNDIIARNFNILINSGGLGGDFLMNLWANPLVGQGNYTTSAFNSLTCSLDGGHMTDLCQGQLSGTAAGAIMGALQ